MGGETFDQRYGFPGCYHSRNITPAGIGQWTDGELYRVITCGVCRDGSAIFPIMPYGLYGQLCDEDIHSIIAYIRTLPPIENKIVAPVSDFPMNFIINTLPKKNQPAASIPPKSDTVNYGRYMITASACHECHTNFIKGDFVK